MHAALSQQLARSIPRCDRTNVDLKDCKAEELVLADLVTQHLDSWFVRKNRQELCSVSYDVELNIAGIYYSYLGRRCRHCPSAA